MAKTDHTALLEVSVEAAKQAGVRQFVYVSVAQYPTKAMADYQQVRVRGEQAILASVLTSTFIRPWYVVGPEHYWPLLFWVVLKLFAVIPSTSAQAKALPLVSLKQMILTLKDTVINTPKGINTIVEVQHIKNAKPLSS